MTDDTLDVARRFASARPGMTLLDCEPISLPYYWMMLDVLVLEHKPTPVLEEFVLETVNTGLDTTSDIAAFLGIDKAIVNDAVIAQYQADSLDFIPTSDGKARRLTLTPTGQQLQQSLEMITPKRSEAPVAFDRLLQRLDQVRAPDLLRAREAKKAGLQPVRPKRARKPSADQLPVEDLTAILRQRYGKDRLAADVLRIIAVLRSSTLYRPGHLLIFRPDDGAELEVMVAIDGRHSQAHTEAINHLGGVRFLGIEPSAGTVPVEERPSLPPELEAQLVPLVKVRHIQERIAEATRTTEQMAPSADAAGLEEASALRIYEHAQTARKQELETLDSIDIRAVETYETKSLFRRALKESHRRLLIIAPWITVDIVDDAFVADLTRLLRAGTVVHVGLGITRNAPKRESEQRGLERLQELAEKHNNLVIGWVGNTHAKVLVSDDWSVVGSFNWLSFSADRDRTYRQEISVLVRRSDFVDPLYQQRRQEIESAPNKPNSPSS